MFSWRVRVDGQTDSRKLNKDRLYQRAIEGYMMTTGSWNSTAAWRSDRRRMRPYRSTADRREKDARAHNENDPGRRSQRGRSPDDNRRIAAVRPQDGAR